jgi:SAM-dependent methyltransferase
MDLREMNIGDQPGQAASALRHPWEQSRANFFRRQLAPHLRPGGRVLDVGAGDGYLASSLVAAVRPGGEVVCFDTGYSDQQLTEFPRAMPSELSFTRLRPGAPFDVVLMLDVLEHVPDDQAFLADIVGGLLAPGGVLLISVPAYRSLFTRHDLGLGHHRRYRLADLRRLVRDAGIEIATGGGLFHSLLPIRVAQKLGEVVRGEWTRPAPDAVPDRADTGLTHWNGKRWLNQATLRMLSLDNWVSATCARAGLGLPGLSAWVLGTKT